MWRPDMDELYEYRQDLMKRLVSVVDDLCAAAAVISSDGWHIPLEAGGWTPHQVLAHLRDIEAQSMAPNLRRILDESDPLLPAFDEDNLLEAHYSPDESPGEILEEYARLRSQELTWLPDAASVAAWNRTARQPCLGMCTFQWWVERSLACAEEHLRQLSDLAT